MAEDALYMDVHDMMVFSSISSIDKDVGAPQTLKGLDKPLLGGGREGDSVLNGLFPADGDAHE